MSWLWRALGASTGSHRRRSGQLADRALERAGELAGAGERAVAEEARAATKGGKIADEAALLAALAAGSRLSLGIEPYRVQLQAVSRLLAGDVIQMATGEGKTLVGALAAAGFALSSCDVHVLTVNDYLARRDAEWMGPLLELFGLSVASLGQDSTSAERQEAYRASVLYSPINEVAFDVLRDAQAADLNETVHRDAPVALVDEADSVLVDEALVPLVLAGAEHAAAPSGEITAAVSRLEADRDFEVDSAGRAVYLTDDGAEEVERALGIESLYSDEHVATTLVQVNLALHARALLARDVDYIVADGKVKLVDASRGRVAALQRWPDGLQAAVEAKEGLEITEGGRILDSTTVQAHMARYETVCGMTGTAVDAVDQLRQFYDLRVSEIERNQPTKRVDEPDRIYTTAEDKLAAVTERIAAEHAAGRPVLVGTDDVAESERVAGLARERGIDAAVLNAKNDEEEAGIIAEAGRPGAVTISTQMAGRGVDIKLGGADEAERDRVVDAGGLCVIGTSRHRTRRLDDQLRGRAGRQGDPGCSVFFASLEDDVVRVGGAGEKVVATPGPDGRLDEKELSGFVAHCQRVTEGQLLEIHAQTWRYNKLLADQREIIDRRRARLLETDAALGELAERAPNRVEELSSLPREALLRAARQVMLFHLGDEWSRHLETMDDVRESIHLRAIARETPIDEFHKISIEEFRDLARRAVDRAVETFESVPIDEDGAHLSEAGLARPSATWTYMVSDNPLDQHGSAASGIRSIFT